MGGDSFIYEDDSDADEDPTFNNHRKYWHVKHTSK